MPLSWFTREAWHSAWVEFLPHPSFIAVVPAAGISSRFGAANKLLHPFGDRPLIETVIERIRTANPRRIVVVTGHDRDRLEAVLSPLDVFLVHNERYADGMGTSIAAGVLAAGSVDAYMIWPGDMPYIGQEAVDVVLEAFEPNGIVVPVHDGRRGHPVLFSAQFHTSLLALEGDAGGRSILERNSPAVIEVRVDDPGVCRDVDVEPD